MKYCKHCNRNVQVHKPINWIAVILIGIFYVPWWLVAGKKYCKECGNKI